MPRTIKRGDTYPGLSGTVTDANGNVPLGTPTSIKLICKHSTGTPVLEFTLTVVNPSATLPNDTDAGKWTYDLDAGDTDTVGEYSCEIQVMWNADDIQTFPNDPADNDTLTIAQDLGD
jgi:hypothetical protein